MPNEKNAKLVVLAENGRRFDVPLGSAPLTIGRAKDCDLVLDDRFASRRHARVEWQANAYVLTDEGSKNGTFLDGAAVSSPHPLEQEEEFQIGGTVLRYVEDDAEDTALMPPGAVKVPALALVVDERAWQVWVDGRQVQRLSPLEFRLLAYLHAHAGAVCTREELGLELWGQGAYTHEMLHQVVHRLKQRLEDDPRRPRLVITVPGVGYRLAIG